MIKTIFFDEKQKNVKKVYEKHKVAFFTVN